MLTSKLSAPSATVLEMPYSLSPSAALNRLKVIYSAIGKMNTFMSSGIEEMRILTADANGFTAEFEVNKEMANPMGYLHGGCTATIFDDACGMTAFIRGQSIVSINSNITYLAPAKVGETVKLEVELLKYGKLQLFTEGRLRRKDNNHLVAQGTFTYSFFPGAQKKLQKELGFDKLLSIE